MGAMHGRVGTGTGGSSGPRLCKLQQEVGRVEVCPVGGCAFWEPGGAVLEGRCAFDGLDVSGNPELAALLLEIRRGLESAASAEERDRARRRFHELLDQSNRESD
jgi:hypothetical protein